MFMLIYMWNENGNFEELLGLKTAWDQKYLDPQNLLQNFWIQKL